MVDKDSIVFLGNQGFGIVEDTYRDLCMVKTISGKESNYLGSSLNDLDNRFVNYIKKGIFKQYYDEETMQEGSKLVGKIESTTYISSNHLSFDFKDERLLQIDVFAKDESFLIQCDCHGKFCKHTYAVLIYLQKIFCELYGCEVKKPTIKNDVSAKNATELYELAKLMHRNPHNLLEIIRNLTRSDEYELETFYHQIDRSSIGSEVYLTIHRSICLNETTRILFLGISGGIQPTIITRNKLLAVYRKASVETKSLDYYLYNFDAVSFVSEYLQGAYHHEYAYAYYQELYNNGHLDEAIIDGLIVAMNKAHPGFAVSQYLGGIFDKATTNQLTKMLSKINGACYCDYKYVKTLSEEKQEEFALSIVFKEKEILPFIKNHLKYFKNNEKKFLEFLILNKRIAKGETLLQLRKYVCDLPGGTYLFDLMEPGYYGDLFACDWFSNDGYVLDYDNIKEEAEALLSKEYFEIEYSVEKEPDGYFIAYLVTMFGRIILEFHVFNENTISVRRSAFERSNNRVVATAVAKWIQEKYHEKIQERIAKIEAELLEERRREMQREAIAKLNTISNKLANTNITLANAHKARLEYLFGVDDDVYISLKVGIDTMYVVKNIISFMDEFDRHSTLRYGKKLELTHDFRNFEETDQKVLKLLKCCNLQKGYGDNRYAHISKQAFKEIMELLKGQQVEINGDSYYVGLDYLKPEVSIDSNHVLHSSFGGDNVFTIEADDELFVADQNKGRIDYVDGNRQSNMLYEFAIDNDNFDLRIVEDKFKETIYSRFADLIKVDESLKSEYKVSDLIIEAYFDYNHNHVEVETKYFLDEHQISERDIKRDIDVIRKTNYDNYLLSLGFIDGVIEEESKNLAFFTMDFTDLKQIARVYLSESIQNKQLVRFDGGIVQVKYNSNIMQAFMEPTGFSDEELYEIIKAIKKKKKYIILSGERIVDVTSEESNEFVETIEDLGLNEKQLSTPKQISIGASLKALAHERNVKIDNYIKDMVSDISNFKNSKQEIAPINGTLRDYQKEGVHWLSSLAKYGVGGILADDMGLGKTVQIITLIANSSAQKPSLIVCPKSLVFNWKNEFAKFTPELEVVEVYGLRNQRKAIIEMIKSNKKVIYISSYDSLRQDIDDYKVEFDYAIIDEAQYIKNVEAQKTISVKQIKASHRLALTGTPIENNVIDLWSIFDFIMPGYLENITKFKALYANSDANAEKLAKRVGLFVLRRTKKEVLNDLPDKFETVMAAEMTSEQRKHYDALRLEAKEYIEKYGTKNFDILPMITRLRQICVDPTLCLASYQGGSGKMEMLKSMIDEYLAAGHRILVFSQFVKALDIVGQNLDASGIPYFRITGDTDAKKRLRICEEFNNDSKEQVVLISLKAGGTGLNLIGADVVIHLDPWWNVAAENQASDRSHRIGQKRNVEVIKLITEDTIEQRVVELQNLKKDLIDKVISDSDESITKASIDDIKFILD